MAGLSRIRVISRECTYTPYTCTCRHTQHACVHANRQRTETPKTFRHSGAHTHAVASHAHVCTHAECGITVIVSARSHTKNRKHGHCRTPLVADTQPFLGLDQMQVKYVGQGLPGNHRQNGAHAFARLRHPDRPPSYTVKTKVSKQKRNGHTEGGSQEWPGRVP